MVTARKADVRKNAAAQRYQTAEDFGIVTSSMERSKQVEGSSVNFRGEVYATCSPTLRPEGLRELRGTVPHWARVGVFLMLRAVPDYPDIIDLEGDDLYVDAVEHLPTVQAAEDPQLVDALENPPLLGILDNELHVDDQAEENGDQGCYVALFGLPGDLEEGSDVND
ncbi:hypothetical protein HPB47_018263 [Ixodes persulcatus]|uniref:Uncharacterized protein n=1 Tax=Ixodes persulcatus TaxID=34615 RepID=A0AC60QNR7_IXOPE|nr:hypothetical protein HPB47_018263 [Ixodes persulcatus]